MAAPGTAVNTGNGTQAAPDVGTWAHPPPPDGSGTPSAGSAEKQNGRASLVGFEPTQPAGAYQNDVGIYKKMKGHGIT
jgi:hypothetical protein